MSKKSFSMLSASILAVLTLSFIFTLLMAVDNVYAAKKYYLPKEVHTVYYGDENTTGSFTKTKYDKFGNLTSTIIGDMIPIDYTIKYRNKKGVISKLTYGEPDLVYARKYYNKKGRLTKITYGEDTYKYTTNKKGIITKVTLNGKLYYKVKKIKYHKNGFVSMVKYNNGNVNHYNSDGLMTSAVVKDGPKYTYKYTKKKGKVVKIITKCDGKLFQKTTLKYGKSFTKNVWKYSCVICYVDGPSNAAEIYGGSSLSGVNAI